MKATRPLFIYLLGILILLCLIAGCGSDEDDNDTTGDGTEDDDDGGDDDSAGDDDDAAADDDAADDDDSGPIESLVYVDDLPVLRLRGSAYERGYELGRVMGDQMVGLYEEYILSYALGLSPEYCGLFKAVKNFACAMIEYQPEEMEQIQGIADAVVDHWDPTVTLVDGSRMELNENDICIANVIADFAQIACSSASAWGSLTEDGQTRLARNLDWEPGPDNILGAATVVVSETPDDLSWHFVSVTVPGFFGCLSCMNGDGRAAFIHDTPRYHSNYKFRLEPRTMLLRRALLAAELDINPLDAFETTLEAGQIDTGNNFHFVRPWENGIDGGACFEVDDNETHQDGFVSLRTGQDVEASNIDTTEAMLVTNHHRKRYEPIDCWRYNSLADAIDALAKSGGTVTLDDLHSMMIDVEFENFTVQTILFQPADWTLIIYHDGPGYLASEHPGTQVPPEVLFPWTD